MVARSILYYLEMGHASYELLRIADGFERGQKRQTHVRRVKGLELQIVVDQVFDVLDSLFQLLSLALPLFKFQIFENLG